MIPPGLNDALRPRVGTTLSNVPIYSHCNHCGHTFESALANLMGASVRASLSGNRESCPSCGKIARVMEGEFFITPEGTEMLSGPQWTRDMLERIAQQLADVERLASSPDLSDQDAREKIDALLEEIAGTNPLVAEHYRALADPQSRKTWALAAKSVAVNVLAVIGAIETIAGFAERVHATWVQISGQ